MTAPGFTIAQTGHSGSGYVSAVLYACGIACGHEQWWTLPGVDQVDGLHGDSSWLAMTDVGFRGYRGVVFHQVREPLACIGSLARHYAEADDDNPYLRRRLQHVLGLPDIDDVDMGKVRGDAVQLAALTWLTMNRTAATRAVLTWRVESFDVAHVLAVAAVAGVDAPDPEAVRVALRTVPRDHNSHGRIGLTWGDIAELDETISTGVQVAAGVYGYEVDL